MWPSLLTGTEVSLAGCLLQQQGLSLPARFLNSVAVRCRWHMEVTFFSLDLLPPQTWLDNCQREAEGPLCSAEQTLRLPVCWPWLAGQVRQPPCQRAVVTAPSGPLGCRSRGAVHLGLG